MQLFEEESDDIFQEDDSTENNNNNNRYGCSVWHKVICIAVPLLILVEASVPHSFGTYIVSIHKETKTNLNILNWIAVLTSAIPYMLVPLATGLINNFSRWYRVFAAAATIGIALSALISSFQKHIYVLFLSYSVLYGLSSALLHGVVISILGDYFPNGHRWHVLATSLFQVGYPTAALIFNPLAAHLIQQFSWDISMRIFAAIILVGGLGLSLLMKPFGYPDKLCISKSDEIRRHSTASTDSETSSGRKPTVFQCCTLGQFIRSPEISLWFIAKLLNYTAWYALRTNMMVYMTNVGFDLQSSSYLMMVYAAGEIITCIAISLFGDWLKGKLLYVHIVAVTCMSILTGCWIIRNTNYTAILVIGALVGTCVQSTLTYSYPAAREVTKLELVTAGSITFSAGGIGILLSPLIGGMLFDFTGSYSALFISQCSIWGSQLILYCIILIVKCFKHCNNYDEM